ncbi:MAG: ribosome biogenesis GTPase Der [Candidatus Magasanikbacteria bacterium]
MTNISKQLDQNLPVIAIVGRTNVGKSTLFNKLIEDNKALVSDVPGTTRTSNEGNIIWRGKNAKVIDTGGLTFEESIDFEEDILKQSEKAMKEADVILFITDAESGVLPQEYELAKRMRRIISKPVILVANKADDKKKEMNIFNEDFAKLGLGEAFPISASSGKNLGELLDLIYKHLGSAKTRPKVIPENAPIQISIIGKPNVGKSSLFNKLIGEEKVIVSDIPHTTREPFDTLVEYEHEEGTKKTKQLINFIDTAGIRRKSRVAGFLEKAGIQKSLDTLDKSDIILFVIDGNEIISSQDMQLGGLIERRSKSVMILVNKWDLNDDSTDAHRNMVKRMVYSYFPHLKFAPILFVSGKTGEKVHQIFPMIMEIWKARHTQIANRALEQFLEEMSTKHKPARGKGTRQPQLFGFRQIGTAPPIFELYVKYRTSLHRSYLNFLENHLREKFDFIGTPIVIKLTKIKR